MKTKNPQANKSTLKAKAQPQAVQPVVPAAAAIKPEIVTKKDLVRLIATATGQAPKEVQATLEAMLKLMSDNLAHGAKISLMGFGSFVVRTRKSRVGFNPQTKNKINIDESITVGFRAGTGLKLQVNQK